MRVCVSRGFRAGFARVVLRGFRARRRISISSRNLYITTNITTTFTNDNVINFTITFISTTSAILLLLLLLLTYYYYYTTTTSTLLLLLPLLLLLLLLLLLPLLLLLLLLILLLPTTTTILLTNYYYYYSYYYYYLLLLLLTNYNYYYYLLLLLLLLEVLIVRAGSARLRFARVPRVMRVCVSRGFRAGSARVVLRGFRARRRISISSRN